MKYTATEYTEQKQTEPQALSVRAIAQDMLGLASIIVILYAGLTLPAIM